MVRVFSCVKATIDVSVSKFSYMKTIFSLFFPLFFSFCFSQNYHEMLDHESEWHLTSCFTGCADDIYYTDGDTIFNGNAYKVLNGYHYISRTFWLREEVQDRQVFLSTQDGLGRKEDLLYDFSLQIGDSININNPLSPFPTNPGFFILDSIVTEQLLDGDDYRFFYLSPSSTSESEEYPVWIEGVGSLSLINAPGGTPDVNEAGKVSCYFNDGQLIYSQSDSTGACVPIYLNVTEEEVKSDLVKVYPTNCNDMLSVSSSNELISSIEIFDLNGAKVLQLSNLNSIFNELDVSALNRGIFVVRVGLPSGDRTFKILKM